MWAFRCPSGSSGVRAAMRHSPTSAIRAGADPSLRASHYSYHQYNYYYDHYRY